MNREFTRLLVTHLLKVSSSLAIPCPAGPHLEQAWRMQLEQWGMEMPILFRTAATERVPVRTKREAGTGGAGFSRPEEHSK